MPSTAIETENTQLTRRNILLRISALSFVAACLSFLVQLPYPSTTPFLFAAVLIFFSISIVSIVCYLMKMLRLRFFKNHTPPQTTREIKTRIRISLLAAIFFGVAGGLLFLNPAPTTADRESWLSSMMDNPDRGLAIICLVAAVHLLRTIRRPAN